MNPTLPLLDPEAIENLRAINPDDGGAFLCELIDIFLDDTPKRLAEIDEALAAGHAENFTRAAHSIKGSAGNFGATQFATMARDLESLGKAGDLAQARAGIPALQAEFARLQPVLAQLKLGS